MLSSYDRDHMAIKHKEFITQKKFVNACYRAHFSSTLNQQEIEVHEEVTTTSLKPWIRQDIYFLYFHFIDKNT